MKQLKRDQYDEDILVEGKRSREGKVLWHGGYRSKAYRIKHELRRYAWI